MFTMRMYLILTVMAVTTVRANTSAIRDHPFTQTITNISDQITNSEDGMLSDQPRRTVGQHLGLIGLILGDYYDAGTRKLEDVLNNPEVKSVTTLWNRRSNNSLVDNEEASNKTKDLKEVPVTDNPKIYYYSDHNVTTESTVVKQSKSNSTRKLELSTEKDHNIEIITYKPLNNSKTNRDDGDRTLKKTTVNEIHTNRNKTEGQTRQGEDEEKWIWSDGEKTETTTVKIPPTKKTKPIDTTGLEDRTNFDGTCPTGQRRFENTCVDID